MLERAALEAYLASPLARYRPWVDPRTGRSPQREFHAAAGTHRGRTFRGGNQSGKTTALVVDHILQLLGWHPFFPFRPPIWSWLSALDWEFGVGQILWPKFREWCPSSEIRSVVWYRRGEPSIPQTIICRNGSRLDFKSAEAGRTKYQGAPLHSVGADEEHPADVVEESRARLLKYGGFFSTSLTPVRRERWVLDFEKEAGTHVTRASTRGAAAAGILNQVAVDSYLDTLPDRQRSVRGEGEFAKLEGLVYQNFSRETHVLRPGGPGRAQLLDPEGRPVASWPIPAHWPRYASIDFGYANATAVNVAALDPARDALIVYRTYYMPGVRISRWAKILGGEGEKPGALPRLAKDMIADHDASERAELAGEGIPTAAAQKDIVQGIEAVERWLEPRREGAHLRPRLEFVLEDDAPPRHPELGRCDCHYLVWELEGYRYPQGAKRPDAPAPRDLPIKKDDHACDSLRYLVFDLDKGGRGAPEPPRLNAAIYDGGTRAGGFAPAPPAGWIV